MIKDPIKDVDCMLMEGTTHAGCHKDGFENESDVEKVFRRVSVLIRQMLYGYTEVSPPSIVKYPPVM